MSDSLRGGKNVGRHTVEIVRDGNLVKVASKTGIAVRAAIFTLYRFEQTAREAWRDGRLVEFVSTTDDDGKIHHVEARPRGAALALIVDGKTALVDPTLTPASLLNPRLVEQSKLFDTADGTRLSVTARLVGVEQIVIRGTPTRARRFAFKGDMNREIWFDAKAIPVQVAFEGKDGSEIKFVLA